MNNSDLKIFTENIEWDALNQIYTLVAQAPFNGKKVRIMPDVHYGKGCVVGFTAELGDKIIPNVIGVDIGCGMYAAELGKTEIDYRGLDDFIKAKIPYGSACRKEYGKETLIKELRCFDKLTDLGRLYGSLGTLGGGNHFIEIDRDEQDNKYLVIHTGSRNLGLQVAKHYQKLAVEVCKNCAEMEKKKATDELNRLKRPDKIPDALAEISAKYSERTKIPAELCYLDGGDMDDYIHDLRICQRFAVLNRKRIAEDILGFLKINKYSAFETVHNFIGDDNIVRKGAIPAYKDQKILIPMNMRDGCLIAVGKGEPDWNFSAPHGAGRLFKRSEAKSMFTVDQYKEEMEGIYTTTANASTLDESPMAYKPMDEIIGLISPTAEILKIIKPVYNFKAADGKE